MNTEEFKVKDSIRVEGITADFVWYEAAVLRDSMQAWGHRFEKLVSVMEARHKEHLKMLGQVMDENLNLKKQLKEQTKESE